MPLLTPFHKPQDEFHHKWHWVKDPANPTEGPMCGHSAALKYASEPDQITCRRCIECLNKEYRNKGIDKQVDW